MRRILLFLIWCVFCGSVYGASVEGGRALLLANSNWEPYKNVRVAGGGLVTEITTQALSRAGYRVDVRVVPWKRALLETYSGNYQVLPGVWKTPDREERLLFSDPVLPTRLILVSHERYAGQYHSLDDLSDVVVGISRGWAYPDSLKNARHFQREEAKDLELNLKKVLFGRIPVAVVEEFAARYTAKAKLGDRAKGLYFSNASLGDRHLYVAFPRRDAGSREVLVQFNAALASMKESGKYQMLLDKYLFSPPD